MRVLMILAMLAAAENAPPQSAIEATIRGTAEPLELQLLVRSETDQWEEVEHRKLPAAARRIRFDGLASGVYQLHVRGPRATQQLATKIVIGTGDTRRATITIEPFVLNGRITHGGTELGAGVIMLRHREFHWRTAIVIAADGTFEAPLWQRGAFNYSIDSPALPTDYAQSVELVGASPVRLAIDIPDGRVTGIVRDAKSGAPVAGAVVALQTNTPEREEHVRLTTTAEGRFDFHGIKYGQQTVRISSPQHLEPEPIVVALDDRTRQRELDVRLDAGRAVAIVVIDKQNDPVANAKVFAVAGSRLCARVVTDEDGRASVPVPAGQAATLFVVAEEGPFGMLRVGRDEGKGRLQLYLPRTSSSLLIRALKTDGGAMPPFSLLMRFDGEMLPLEVLEELAAVQRLRFATGPDSEAYLQNIPSGTYEFWPYRSTAEAESIVAAGALAPIQVNVRVGENKIAVKFAGK